MSKIKRKSRNQRRILDTTQSIKIASEVTRRDIEKSYNIDSTEGTEAHYSDRYGWTLRKSFN